MSAFWAVKLKRHTNSYVEGQDKIFLIVYCVLFSLI